VCAAGAAVAMKFWHYLIDQTIESARHLESAGIAALIFAAALTAFGTWATYRASGTKEHLNDERANRLTLEILRQQERAALAEQRLLAEQRGSATVRWRLERLERAVLPRSLTDSQRSALLTQLHGLGPINIAMSTATEATLFGVQFDRLFKEAGVHGRIFAIPPGVSLGVTVYVINRTGESIAQILRAQNISGGEVRLRPIGFEGLPADQNALIIGENDGALRGGNGQPGEGIDEHGYPVPEPRP
jgi:hypothetical protein